MKRLTLFSLVITSMYYLSAQSFMPTISFTTAAGQTTYIVKNDDSKIWGKTVVMTGGMNGMLSLTLKDTVTGEKVKYKIPDMKEVGVWAKGMSKLKAITSSLESTNSLKDATRTDYSMLDADYYIFRRVVDKKGKPRILQLLNPGFDSKMQAYADPRAKQTGGTKLTGGLTGGLDKSYYVTRGGAYGVYVEKGKYKKSMSSIFDGCSELLKKFDTNFKDFAKHVHYFENECN